MDLRDIENLLKKKINAKWSIIFNRACLKENMTPKYVRNYLRSKKAQFKNTPISPGQFIADELVVAEDRFSPLEKRYDQCLKILSDRNEIDMCHHLDVFSYKSDDKKETS